MAKNKKKQAVILYHSSTGNTAAYMNAVAEGLTESGFAVETIRFDKAEEGWINGADLVGFAVPVFQWHPPFHVRDFLKALPDFEGKPFFAFVSCGGKPCNTIHMLATPAVEKGARYLDGRIFYGEESYPHLRFEKHTQSKGRPDAEDLADARRFGVEIADKALNGKGEAQKVPPFHWDFLTVLGKLTPPWGMRKAMGTKHINPQKCIKCGLCAEECPVGAITLEPEPSFADNCIGCCGCFNCCPTGAFTASLLRESTRYPGIAKNK